MLNRLDDIQIIPRDSDRSIRFYTEVMGFTVKERMQVPSPPLGQIAYLAPGEVVDAKTK